MTVPFHHVTSPLFIYYNYIILKAAIPLFLLSKWMKNACFLILYAKMLTLSGLLIFRAVAEPQNSWSKSAKFGRNRIKYMSVQHFWNLSQLLGLFTCRKLANLSRNFVTEMCKQRPETTRRRLCCEKLGTSHNVRGFAIGSFLERIVVERANDDFC